MIDLLHPNADELLKKWQHVIDQTKAIWTWTNNFELAWIAEYASQRPSYCEIGSHSGRSAKVALLANPNLALTSFDTWDDLNSLETFKENLRDEIEEGRVIFYQGESQTTFPEFVRRYPSARFDGCWIDGGHLEHLVAADIKNVIPLMNPGSLLSGHDYEAENRNDVWRGVNSVLTGVHNPVDHVWAYQL